MHIPADFIQELLARTDILEVIRKRITVKKAGRNYLALCPFHNEKTPSFNVNPDKQFYHCFGCGASGDAIHFLREYDKLEFREAVERLAQPLGMVVPATASNPEQDSRHKIIYEFLQQAAQWFGAQLKSPQGQVARRYLAQRGIDEGACDQFSMGYAPSGWQNLLKHLSPKEDPKTLSILYQAGLVSKNEQGRHYDRFRHRIIFPIRDSRGRVVAFGGRVLDDQEKPKYLNSPETAVFHKSRELYGLYESRLIKSPEKSALVVEGYLDVMAVVNGGLENAGLGSVVATLGTAISSQHIQRLARQSSSLFFAFDGDAAGRKAAWRALEHGLAAHQDGLSLNFLFLPQGEDPDSFIKQYGAKGLKSALSQSMTASDFFFNTLSHSHNLGTLEGRAAMVQQAKPLIAAVPEGALKELLYRQLSHITGVSVGQLMQSVVASGYQPNEVHSLGQSVSSTQARRQSQSFGQVHEQKQENSFSLQSVTRVSNSVGLVPLLIRILHLLLHYPQISKGISSQHLEIMRRIDCLESSLLLQIYRHIQETSEIASAELVAYWQHHQGGSLVQGLARKEVLLSLQQAEHELADTLAHIEKQQTLDELDLLLLSFRQRGTTSAPMDPELTERLKALLSKK